MFNEVCVNLLRRANFTEAQITQLIESFYDRCCVVELTKSLAPRVVKSCAVGRVLTTLRSPAPRHLVLDRRALGRR